MRKPVGKQVESYTGMAAPTLGIATRSLKDIRRAQIVAADIELGAAGDDDATDSIREAISMLGLKQLTGLEKY